MLGSQVLCAFSTCLWQKPICAVRRSKTCRATVTLEVTVKRCLPATSAQDFMLARHVQQIVQTAGAHMPAASAVRNQRKEAVGTAVCGTKKLLRWSRTCLSADLLAVDRADRLRRSRLLLVRHICSADVEALVAHKPHILHRPQRFENVLRCWQPVRSCAKGI